MGTRHQNLFLNLHKPEKVENTRNCPEMILSALFPVTRDSFKAIDDKTRNVPWF